MNPSKRAKAIFRASEWFQQRNVPVFPQLLRALNLTLHGIDIEHGVKMGRNVQFPHPSGVVIGAGTVIGDDVLVLSGVVLGLQLSPGREDGYPRIASRVYLGSGCKVFGPVTIGYHSKIGANVVVTKDVPAETIHLGSQNLGR